MAVIALASIVTELTIIDTVAVSADAVSASVTAKVAAAAAVPSGFCSLSRGGGAGDGNCERRNCWRGAFSSVLSFFLRPGMLVEHEAMCASD
jgi:hypothetical protein